jgi:hypothetical protein
MKILAGGIIVNFANEEMRCSINCNSRVSDRWFSTAIVVIDPIIIRSAWVTDAELLSFGRCLPEIKAGPTAAVTVVAATKPRQSASEMSESIEKLLLDEKPNLVLWQTGTFDAVRGLDPEEFRASVADGVETIQAGGADVILMNQQYSPRTESMVALGLYADNMRWVAREREVPLFDRLAIMRYWYDSGQIDLYAATKDIGTAKLVHDCIGRALASMIIDAARLDALEGTTSQ